MRSEQWDLLVRVLRIIDDEVHVPQVITEKARPKQYHFAVELGAWLIEAQDAALDPQIRLLMQPNLHATADSGLTL